MKRFVEIAWNRPASAGLFNHLRNDFRFNEEHLRVFDSVTQHCGTADFHADNTDLDKKKFAHIYSNVAEVVLNELIRLAEVGYKAEVEQKLNHSQCG